MKIACHFFSMTSLASLLLLCGALFAEPAMAGWKVDKSNSTFNFVTVKAGKPGTSVIQEVQTFKDVSGEVNDQGKIEVNVALGSVDTGVEIRDQRIKDMLFKVGVYPTATFSGKTDVSTLKKLSPGSSKNIDLDGTITLSGVAKPLLVKLRVVKLTGNSLLVETRSPLIINASDFGLESGVEAMRNVMGLSVLSSAAPVSFSILLK